MSKIVKCKSCGREIPINSKGCPFCGEKNKKTFYTKWWVWVIAAIVFAAVGGKIFQEPTTDISEESITAESKRNETGEITHSVGEIVTTDKFEITVKNVQTKFSVGTQHLSSTPSEGGVYVCVDFEYKNITQKPVAAYARPKVKLKASGGDAYDVDISATAYYVSETDPEREVLSELNPNAWVRESAVFEISKAAYDSEEFTVSVGADRNFDVKIN